MSIFADLWNELKDLTTTKADVARLQTANEQLRKDIDQLKNVNGTKYALLLNEARLSFWKFVYVIAAIAVVAIFAQDNIARLLRPKTPSLGDRITLFIGEHDAQSATKYLDECVNELKSLSQRLALQATPSPPSSAPASVVPPAVPPQPAPAASPVAAPAPAASGPVRLGQRQVGRLREACGQLIGE